MIINVFSSGAWEKQGLGWVSRYETRMGRKPHLEGYVPPDGSYVLMKVTPTGYSPQWRIDVGGQSITLLRDTWEEAVRAAIRLAVLREGGYGNDIDKIGIHPSWYTKWWRMADEDLVP